MKKCGMCLAIVLKRLKAILFLTLMLTVAAPVHAQTKWKAGILQAKGDAGFTWMAQQQGYFKERGLEVEFMEFRGDKDIMRAMLAGEVDSADMNPGPALGAIDRGATNLRFIGSPMPGLPYALYVGKDITSWSQLKDKTFGVSAPGSQPEIVAREMLIRKGVNADSMKIVNAGGSGSRIKALVAGKIDATASSSEYIPDAERLGIRVMALTADLLPEYPHHVLVMREETLKAKREATINFLAAYMEGLDYSVKHRDETLKLSGKINEKPATDPQLVYIYDELIAKKYVAVKLDIPRAKIEWLQNQLLKVDVVRKKIDLDKFIDDSYREEALKRAKLR